MDYLHRTYVIKYYIHVKLFPTNILTLLMFPYDLSFQKNFRLIRELLSSCDEQEEVNSKGASGLPVPVS